MTPRITTIRDQVYGILKDNICKGKYHPGQWLQETALATELHVSRSPVRDALHQLAKDGLVNEIPNRGVFVREFTAKDIEELFDLRILFESYAIRLVTGDLTEKRRSVLKDYYRRFQEYADKQDLKEYTRVDTAYHRSLLELTDNKMALWFYDSVKDMYARFRMAALTLPGRFQESAIEHMCTIEYILNGEAEKAVDLNERHLLVTKACCHEAIFRAEEMYSQEQGTENDR